MRHTGKYWWLTMCSALMALTSNILISCWNSNTGWFQLWFDIAPNGFSVSAVITSTLIAIIASVSREDLAVATGITYLFRTVAQVLGVSLSGAIVQGVLLRELRSKITGPGSEEIIEKIRHSTLFIHELEPSLQKDATDSYATAIRVVFIGQAVMAFLTFLSSLPIQEFTLPGSHAEQEEVDRRRLQNGTR